MICGVRVVNVRHMSALTAPKGPLPARVYWFRRLLVLAVVFGLVYGSARLLSGSGDGSSDERVVTVSAEQETPAEPTPTASASPDGQPKKAKKQRKVKKTPPPLPEPVGTCEAEDVVITPEVVTERTGPQVKIKLVLRSQGVPACNWQVSPSTVTVKIDSGKRSNPDDIWQSRHCPKVIPTKDVVVYAKTDTVVPITWDGKRSGSDCTEQTDWAKLGWYHVKAAAYAGEPTDVQFELTRPTPVTVVKTVEPEPEKRGKNKKDKKSDRKKRAGDRTPTPSKTPKPSGAVEPDID